MRRRCACWVLPTRGAAARGLPALDADADARELAVASARARLDAAVAGAAWSEGAAMSLEEIAAHVSRHLDDLPGT